MVITTEADTCGNIQNFSEYVEEIRDIFKIMVIILKIFGKSTISVKVDRKHRSNRQHRRQDF